MPPRAYNNESRQLQQAELKARIAAAAAELHATQGALATSYAQVAERAGVSLPTVYKHYPTLDELLQACTAHVAELAPAFPQEEVLAAPDIEAAAEVLVRACDATNAHFEPWLVWREHSQLEVLRQLAQSNRRQLTAVAKAVLQHHGHDTDAADCAAVWESILTFDFWHRLVREHKLSRQAARARQVELLLAAAGPRPAASTSRPTSRKKP